MSGNRPANLRMYGSIERMCRNAHTANAGYVGISRNRIYKNPYSVTGAIKHTGSEQAPKGTCKDRFVGTWKAVNTNSKRIGNSMSY
jgi:hypothetical protein